MKNLCVTIVLGSMLLVQAHAQQAVRQADQFWKRRVVNRISLVEKINRPLVYHTSNYYGSQSGFKENNGVVASLINGLKEGKYLAYDPYEWERAMTYDDILKRMEEFDQAVNGNPWGEGEYQEEEESNFDESESDVWDTEEGNDDWGDDFDDAPQFGREAELDLGPYEEILHMVEDRIFDKGRSQMVNKIDFFELIWVDPTGILPEKVLARFLWKDVKAQLERTQWKARFNDATGLSMAHAFEMRLFHGFMIDVGGQPIRSLWEAEKRRQEIVEFEHHLWSY
ncbi:MAG: hypothetical protein AAFW00_09400 [Bacteroidota bacterium]